MKKASCATVAVVLAAGLAAVTPGFAQAQHKMQLKVEPPKAVVMPAGGLVNSDMTTYTTLRMLVRARIPRPNMLNSWRKPR